MVVGVKEAVVVWWWWRLAYQSNGQHHCQQSLQDPLQTVLGWCQCWTRSTNHHWTKPLHTISITMRTKRLGLHTMHYDGVHPAHHEDYTNEITSELDPFCHCTAQDGSCNSGKRKLTKQVSTKRNGWQPMMVALLNAMWVLMMVVPRITIELEMHRQHLCWAQNSCVLEKNVTIPTTTTTTAKP